jgi:phage/plasmid-associated DNA primase
MYNRMEHIKELVSQKYSLWNVGTNKAPCTQYGRGMIGWIDKTYDELVKEHNYECKLWGMKMGHHENGKRTMSLDFDVCGDKNEATGERMGCPNTTRMLTDLLDFNPTLAGLYTSSTQGNMNVIIEYSQCPQICEFVDRLATNKFQCNSLEILLGGNQVIPPSATKCKITGSIGQPRAFVSSEPFYVLTEKSDCYVANFLKELMTNKLQSKAPIVKPVAVRIASPSPITVVNNPPEHQADKYLDLLYNVIKNDLKENGSARLNWDQWFQIAGILKYNGYGIDVWTTFCERSTSNKATYSISEWTGIKNTTPMSIFGLQSIAKEVNPIEYREWLIRHNVYFIKADDLEDPYKVAMCISKTLKEILVLCNENWYMLSDNNLWRQQKEPSFYIIKEVRKYIDESNKQLVIKIAKTDGEEKDKLVEMSKLYLKSYKAVSSSGFLNVLTKFLKTLLTDLTFADRLDATAGILAFQNGIMDLKTKQFRQGILASDLLTQTIPHDYAPCDQTKMQFIKDVLTKILNNNVEHMEYYASLIGFSFIGSPNLEKSIYFCVDKTSTAAGDNGKTFFNDILNELMPNYVYKTKGTLIEEGNTKIHKQLAMLKGKRFVWLDELSKRKLNAELMKEIGDGLKIENEVMFGTSEILKIMFKMWILTNNIPTIDAKDTAVFNRLKQISYGSHFDRTGLRTVENPEKLEFIADISLGDKIKADYKNEIFNFVIDYANKYYKSGLPSIPQQFKNDTKETQSSNDEFGKWFSENCELDPTGRVAEKAIMARCEMTSKLVREGMSRKGLVYNKDLSKMGVDQYNKPYKGGYVGIKMIALEEEEYDGADM